jgi:hypothetical protein
MTGSYVATNGGSGGGGCHNQPNFVGGGGNDTDYVVLMTSNTAPFGVASASTELSSSYAAWKAMDNSNTTSWLANSPTVVPQWIQYQLASSQIVDRYSITVEPGRTFKTWALQASNTGSFSGEEVTLHSQTNAPNWGANEKRSYSFTNSTSYKYYRIYITEGNGVDYPGIAEWELLKPIVDEGYMGGFGNGTNFLGGGGGGATSVGVSGASGGAGGTGKTSSISGASVTYSTGGNGAYRGQGNGSSAANNTGNGGNAGGSSSGNASGGNGGSGIVIIRYRTDGTDGISPLSSGGTITTSGEYTIHTFTTGGTFTCVTINSTFLMFFQ